MDKIETAKKPKIILPKRGTRSAEKFFATWIQTNQFLDFLIRLVAHTDHVAKVAHEASIEVEDDEKKKAEMISEWKTKKFAVDDLKQNRQFLLEVILVRHVENFLNYISGLLFEIFIQRPETLRSSDKIEVANILKHDSIDAVILEIAEKKVDDLSYSSFRDLTDFFQDRFNLALMDETALKIITEAIEVRNISVHNRCIVNKRFISRLGLGDENLGKKRELHIGYLDEVIPLLAKVVKSIEKQAVKKFKLKGVRFSTTANR